MKIILAAAKKLYQKAIKQINVVLKKWIKWFQNVANLRRRVLAAVVVCLNWTHYK